MMSTGSLCCLVIFLPTAVLAAEYRLIEPSSNSGILQVKTPELATWGTVCAAGYDVKDASVICRSLGMPHTDARPLQTNYSDVYSPVVVRGMDCKGDEQSLTDCPNVTINIVACPENSVVRVYCAEALEDNFRLLGGYSLSAGRVEIFRKGRWGTADMLTYGDEEAQVLCRSLGFPYNMARFLHPAFTPKTIWFKEVQCIGNESSWLECQHTFHVFPERDSFNVAVSCEDLRLVNRTGNTGVLEGYYFEKWRPVYSAHFTDLAASVACRVLDLPRSGAEVLHVGTNTLSLNETTILSVGDCKGYEPRLTNCQTASWTLNRFRNMFITCKPVDLSEVKFRLMGYRSDVYGSLEVYVNNVWGAVCNAGVTNQTAAVACRTLGLPSENALVVPNEYVGTWSGDFWMHGLNCKGTEQSLLDCDFNPWSTGECYDWNALGIYCGTFAYEFMLRLVDGKDENSGRVQIFSYGVWHRLCRPSHDLAKVLCRQLRKPSLQAKTTSCFDEGTEPVFRQEFRCESDDIGVQNCYSSSVIDINNCESVRVICSDEIVDDKNCFGLESWIYVVICVGIATVLFFICIFFKSRTVKKCGRRENEQSSQRPALSSVRMTNIPDNQNAEMIPSQTPYADPPPSYKDLFEKKETGSPGETTDQETKL